MCREKNILALFQSQALMNIACFNFRQILMKYFGHWRTCHISTLSWKSALCKVSSCVL